MKYTSKLRLLLIIIAVLPPIIILSILKFSTEAQVKLEQKKKVEESFEKANAFILSEQGHVRYNVQELSTDSLFLKRLYSKKKNLQSQEKIFDKYGFRFLYITNDSGRVLYSFGKLLLEKAPITNIKEIQDQNLLTKEIDQQDTHASLTYVTQIDSFHYIYAGRYVDQSMKYLLENISDASLLISFKDNPEIDLSQGIHKTEKGYQALLLKSSVDKISITLHFTTETNGTLFNTVSQIIFIVTFCMIILALLIGLYLTGKTKKEIDNLRSTFAQVADGDFNTAVMAYEKSEFSELADSFSEMLLKLKNSQAKLATVEKIAAWETVGRKLAHEIKNPLSPISIAADDLRMSYYEKLPNFDKTIDESTATIKKEVRRMTLLLDEFVSFARMKQSELQETDFSGFITEIQHLYKNDINEKRLQIKCNIKKTILKIDSDTLTQVFVNLIKNGFESKPNAVVSVDISKDDNNIKISVSDNGPGFTKTKLENSFTPFDTTKETGTGLGLIICHRIVLDHNGSMILQNRKNGGGEVLITLPIT